MYSYVLRRLRANHARRAGKEYDGIFTSHFDIFKGVYIIVTEAKYI